MRLIILVVFVLITLNSKREDRDKFPRALCVLISGPFANLSEDFNHVVDLTPSMRSTDAILTRVGAAPRPVS